MVEKEFDSMTQKVPASKSLITRLSSSSCPSLEIALEGSGMLLDDLIVFSPDPSVIFEELEEKRDLDAARVAWKE